MKERILFIVFSVLLIAGVAYQNTGNKSLACRDSMWAGWNGTIEQNVLTAGEDIQGRILRTEECMMGKGNYTVSVIYSSSVPGSRVTAERMGTVFMDVELPVSEEITVITIPLTLEDDTGTVSFHAYKEPGSILSLQGFDITGEQPFNNDYIYLAVLLALLLALLYGLLFLKRGRIGREKLCSALVIAAAACFVSVPMFQMQIFRASEMAFYFSAAEGIKDAWKSGQFPALVYPYAWNGYGGSAAQFPVLFLYPAAFLRMMGVSLLAAYKSLLFAVNLGTGAIAYFSANRLFRQNRKAALLFSVLYLTAFYRITVLWGRSDLGELLGLAFLPLIAAGLYELLAGDRRKWWYLAVGYGGLLQCHIPALLIAGFFSLFVGLCYIDVFFREKRWVGLLKALGCALAFNAWYLVPFMTFVRSGVSVTGQYGNFCGGLLHVMDLFHMDSDRAVQDAWAGYPGLSVLFCTFLAAAGTAVEKERSERQRYLSVMLAAGIGFALAATNLAPWQLLGEIRSAGRLMEWLRYPRYFLGAAVMALLLAGTGWLSESQFLRKYAMYGGGVIVLAAMVGTLSFLDCQVSISKGLAANVLPASEQLTGLPGGTDLQDLMPLPRVSDEEKVAVLDYVRNGKQAEICVFSQSENQFVEFPIFNYPGYRVFDRNGVRLPVGTGTNNRVRVSIPPADQEQIIRLEYAGKRMFLAGYGITLAAAFGAVGYMNRERLRRWLKK